MERREIEVPDLGRPGYLPQGAPSGWKVPLPSSLLFVGGQISADRDGHVVAPGDLERQAQNVFRDIGRILRDGGATWSDVVRMDAYYVLDGSANVENYWSTMSRVCSEFLPEPGPVWSAIQVPGLAYPGLLLEVDAIAVLEAPADA